MNNYRGYIDSLKGYSARTDYEKMLHKVYAGVSHTKKMTAIKFVSAFAAVFLLLSAGLFSTFSAGTVADTGISGFVFGSDTKNDTIIGYVFSE